MVVPGQHAKIAELIEGVVLAGHYHRLTVERHCPGQGGGGGQVAAGLCLQDAQFGERVGLAEPVSSLPRRDEGVLVEGG